MELTWSKVRAKGICIQSSNYVNYSRILLCYNIPKKHTDMKFVLTKNNQKFNYQKLP